MHAALTFAPLHLPLSLSPSGGQQREIIISKSDTKVLITDYSPMKDYTVSVLSVSGGEQSRPLQGRHKGAFIHSYFCSVAVLKCVPPIVPLLSIMLYSALF